MFWTNAYNIILKRLQVQHRACLEGYLIIQPLVPKERLLCWGGGELAVMMLLSTLVLISSVTLSMLLPLSKLVSLFRKQEAWNL